MDRVTRSPRLSHAPRGSAGILGMDMFLILPWWNGAWELKRGWLFISESQLYCSLEDLGGQF